MIMLDVLLADELLVVALINEMYQDLFEKCQLDFLFVKLDVARLLLLVHVARPGKASFPGLPSRAGPARVMFVL